jgi:long-chain acyl-CoA synthetase
MTHDSWGTLPAMFFDRAARLGEKPFLWAKSEGLYRPKTWAAAARDVRRVARGLRSLEIGPGDRVGLVAENRPEWVIADLAIMSAGAITVPGYVTRTVEDHRHLLADSGARAVIVSTAPSSTNVLAAANQVESVHTVIEIEPTAARAGLVDIRSWREVLARGSHDAGDISRYIDAIKPDDIACLIYTSGASGIPKGVMTSHRNILANCRGLHGVLETLGLDDEVFLNFLPLSHSYEHTAGMMLPISLGAQIFFAEGAETLAANMLEARPTIVTAVPRLYEILHRRIRSEAERRGAVAKLLLDQAARIGRKRLVSQPVSFGERLVDPLLDRLVRSKLHRRFGGRLKAMISAGAPLNPEIGSFFLALGVRLLQGYGQTEAGPGISCNSPAWIKIDTVGPPLDGVRVRIAEDGEIWVAGENVMNGYWNDPEATDQVLDDGWLKTGDIGFLDRDGFLRITDRKRDIIKTSGGEMISPARLEGYLTTEPEISQAMVFGDRRPYLVAILVPDPDFVNGFAPQNSEMPPIADDPRFTKAIGTAVARVNQLFSPYERIRRFLIADERFTIANGLMTPTLKIRRNAIRETYCAALDALYERAHAAD